MLGFLLINKPIDWTSHDVVGYLRKITHIKKIGHAGTLDPFATGLLIVAVGREHTKRLDEFKNLNKTYIATLHLGATSDTLDRTGIIHQISEAQIDVKNIQEVIKNFIGHQDQLPPMYSAKKIAGKKLYKLARKGIEVERKPNRITIFDLQIVDYAFPYLRLHINCSPGTYIRTLAHDIGQQLNVGAYCETLERTHIGEFSLANAIEVKKISRDTWEQLLF